MARILVIDDDPNVLKALDRILRSGGYEVEAVTGGRSGMAALDRQPADLVITDINMPDMDGIEVIIAVKEAGTPVIAISGGGLIPKAHLLDSADWMGAVETIEKPFTPATVLDRVAKILG